MGQKVNPLGFRLGINKTWDSRWFSGSNFANYVYEDLQIRKFISSKNHDAGIAKIEIERAAKQIVVKLYTAKPGKFIGRQGKGIEILRDELCKLLKKQDKNIKIDVFEVKNPDIIAKLAAENVATQLEKRLSFRRAMRKVMQQAMKAGASGIKVRVSGRLNGADMARTEWYMEGRVPLHTLRADIDYGTAEAHTTYGLIGCKVWIFKGEIYEKSFSQISTKAVGMHRPSAQ